MQSPRADLPKISVFAIKTDLTCAQVALLDLDIYGPSLPELVRSHFSGGMS